MLDETQPDHYCYDKIFLSLSFSASCRCVQVKPVHFTVHAVVTTSDLRFDRAEVDFGFCSVDQSVRSSVRLTNLSLQLQEFGFTGLPEVNAAASRVILSVCREVRKRAQIPLVTGNNDLITTVKPDGVTRGGDSHPSFQRNKEYTLLLIPKGKLVLCI